MDPVEYLEAVQFTATRQRAQRQELECSVQDGQWRLSHDPLVAVVLQVSGRARRSGSRSALWLRPVASIAGLT
jgi:hypothetical protein